MTTLTQGLINLIRTHPVSSQDLHKTALFTLDAISNSIAGRNSDPGRKLLEWSKNRPLDTGRRAFLLGALTHILEVDDIHRASVVHTGCVTVPAVLAIACEKELPGDLLLKAVLFGFEAACRVGMAVGPAHYKVWHNTATCGPYGSAMASATLLNLSEPETIDALGNAGTQSAGVWEFLKTGAMSKHLHAGRAAEAGVVAAELAQRGFSGPPEILEGETGFFAATCLDPDPDAVLRDPTSPWQLHQTSIKPWPSCRHTHPAIDAALSIADQVDTELVRSVVLKTYDAAIDVCDRQIAASAYEAKFSLQHCVAAALHRGRIDFSAFDEVARKSSSELAQKVTVEAASPYDKAYPKAWGAAIEVVLENGNKLTAEAPECRGDPECALSDIEMLEKASDLMRFGGVNDPKAIIEGVMLAADGTNFPDTSFILQGA